MPGSQSTRLRLMLRLHLTHICNPAGECSARIRATELPTVPNPTIATFRDFGVLGCSCSVSTVAELGFALVIELILWSHERLARPRLRASRPQLHRRYFLRTGSSRRCGA